jgi:hypothetical protein
MPDPARPPLFADASARNSGSSTSRTEGSASHHVEPCSEQGIGCSGLWESLLVTPLDRTHYACACQG